LGFPATPFLDDLMLLKQKKCEIFFMHMTAHRRCAQCCGPTRYPTSSSKLACLLNSVLTAALHCSQVHRSLPPPPRLGFPPCTPLFLLTALFFSPLQVAIAAHFFWCPALLCPMMMPLRSPWSKSPPSLTFFTDCWLFFRLLFFMADLLSESPHFFLLTARFFQVAFFLWLTCPPPHSVTGRFFFFSIHIPHLTQTNLATPVFATPLVSDLLIFFFHSDYPTQLKQTCPPSKWPLFLSVLTLPYHLNHKPHPRCALPSECYHNVFCDLTCTDSLSFCVMTKPNCCPPPILSPSSFSLTVSPSPSLTPCECPRCSVQSHPQPES